MQQKQLYMAPEAETLVVQTEGVICQSGNFPINGFEDGGTLNDFPITPQTF